MNSGNPVAVVFSISCEDVDTGCSGILGCSIVGTGPSTLVSGTTFGVGIGFIPIVSVLTGIVVSTLILGIAGSIVGVMSSCFFCSSAPSSVPLYLIFSSFNVSRLGFSNNEFVISSNSSFVK